MKFRPVTFTDANGQQQSVNLNLEIYAEAEKRGLTVPQLLNVKYPTNAEQHGQTFAQMLASAGVFLSANNDYGIRPPTVAQVLNGDTQVNLGTITAPAGEDSDTPAGRLFFPAALLEMIESSLRPNLESYVGQFMQLVAFTRSVNSNKYEQVIINYSRPAAARGQPIGQLSLPTTMLSVTTSSKTRTIPTISIGMEISREAIQHATLDLIGLALAEQAINQRVDRMTNDLVSIVQGSVDSGDDALSSTPIKNFDSTIAANGVMTQKAWVKWLRNNSLKRQITDVICDVDAFLAIQGRTGRPTVMDISGLDERLNSVPTTDMGRIGARVNFFITEGSPLGANTCLGLDRSKALRRVVYVGADYSAVEDFVLRKGLGMRIDFAERIEQAGYSEAFDLMTLTTA